MALVIKQMWNPSSAEKRVLDYLREIYTHEEHDVFLIHNFLLGTLLSDDVKIHPIKPDFIILDPLRGIAIVEVKDWEEFKLEGNFAILKDGSRDLNPIIKGQNYFFNMAKILKRNNVGIKQSQLKSHLVFIKQRSDLRLNGDFVTSHFSDFKKTLVLDNLFNETELINPKLVDHAIATICPEMYFSKDKKGSSKLVHGPDQRQSEIIKKNPYGHYLVSGIPGSGKSVLLASRAIFLNDSFPTWNILVLSVNRNLVDQIDSDLKRRTNGREGVFQQKKIECTTLINFLKDCCPSKHLEESKFISGYLNQINFFRKHAEPKTHWDAVLIDEYQDFTDEDFTIILGSCKKHQATINREERLTENLFLSGDKLQQIWEEGCSDSWEKLDIHIRGRSSILKTSYRSPSDIVSVALEFLMRSGLAEEVKQFYEGIDDIAHLQKGIDSINFEIGWDTEATILSLRVKQLLSSGVSPSNILLIAPPGKNINMLKAIFENEISNGLVVGTHNEVKGLESEYVFIYNLGSFDFLLRSQKTKAKIIYMCLTRATHFVCLTSFKEEGSISLIKEIVSALEDKKDVA